MAIRTGRWVAAAAFVVAAVACLLAFNKVLGAGSPWCDGATVLPSVICDLHPTRWVSKGYPPGLFGSRKSRAGSPLPTQLSPDLDAAADFGETAGGIQTHPAGGTGEAEEATADSLSNAAPANEAAGTAQTAPGQPQKAEVDSQPQQPQPGAPDEQTAERPQEQASEQPAATPAGSASQAEQQRFEEQQKEQLQPDAALAEQQPTEQQAVAADDRQPVAQPEESTGADTDAEPAGQQANEGALAEQQPAEGTQPDADAQQADEGTSAEQQPPQGTQPDADAQHDPQSQQLPAQTAASAAAGAESAGLEAAAPAEQRQAEGAQPDPTAQQQPDGGSGKPAEEQQPQQPDGQADGSGGESAEQQLQQPETGDAVDEQQAAETQVEQPEVGDAAGEQQAAEAPAEGRLPPVREWVDDQEVIWEKPRGKARGIFLALNGCNHGADGWWDAQPACKDCLGLPEEKAIVKAAIDRGHVTIALSVVQQRTKMRCWANLTPPNVNTDMKSTLKTVKLLVEREGWQGLPLYAWGGSAGGTFAARLPYYLRMEGIMVQLKSVKGEELDADPKDPATGEAWPYPKVVYAYNRRDPVAQQRAIDYTGALKAKGVHYALLAADPTPLTPDFFARRVEEINATVSAQLYDALKIHGVLDEHGYLPRDPRKSDKRWQAVLREQVPYANTVRLEKYVSSIFEELNWAYSNHQGISDCTAASFEFFESGKQPDEKMLENPGFWALQGQQPPDGSPP